MINEELVEKLKTMSTDDLESYVRASYTSERAITILAVIILALTFMFQNIFTICVALGICIGLIKLSNAVTDTRDYIIKMLEKR